MIIIYDTDKQKAEKMAEILTREHPDIGKVNVITDLSELTDCISDEISLCDFTKHVEFDLAEDGIILADEIYRRIKEQPASIPFVPNFEIPQVEHFIESTKTEYQKLSGFDRKEKNQARRRLERQALNYQNKHWKK